MSFTAVGRYGCIYVTADGSSCQQHISHKQRATLSITSLLELIYKQGTSSSFLSLPLIPPFSPSPETSHPNPAHCVSFPVFQFNFKSSPNDDVAAQFRLLLTRYIERQSPGGAVAGLHFLSARQVCVWMCRYEPIVRGSARDWSRDRHQSF